MALSVKTGSFARPAAGTTDTTVSTVGFLPAAVIFFASNVITAGTWRAKLETAIGFAAKTPGDQTTIVGASASVGSNDASASPSARLAAQGALRVTDGSGAVQAEAAGFTFNSSGFVIDWLNSPYDGEQENIGYVALGGDAKAVAAFYQTSAAQLAAASFDTPIDARFVPTAAIVLAAADNAASTGVFAGASQWALSLADQLGANPTNQYRRLDNDRAVTLLNPANGSVRYGGRVSAMRSDGVTLTRVDGNFWSLLNTYGSGPGAGTSPLQFNTPGQVARDSSGNFYVADRSNSRLLKLSAAGAFISSTTLSNIAGVALDASDNIYVVMLNGTKYNVQKYNSAIVQQWSVYVAQNPKFLWVDGTWLYLTNSIFAQAHRIDLATGLVQQRTLGTGIIVYGSGDGQLSNDLQGVAVRNGELYLVDAGNNRIQVFTINSGNGVATYARKWTIPAGGRGIGFGSDGSVYVASTGGTIGHYTNTGALIDTITQAGADGLVVIPGDVVLVTSSTVHTLTRWDEVPPAPAIAVLLLGGLTANCGVSAKPITAAPATHTIATGMNSKAVLLMTHQDTTLATAQDHMRRSMGASDGTAHVNVTGHAQDAVSTSNSDDRFDAGFVLVKANNTANTDEAKATAAFTAGNLVLTWNPNDAVATQIAWMTFGNATPLEAYFAAQSGLFPSKPGVPTPLSSLIEAAAAIPYAVIGNQGNFSVAQIDAVSTTPFTGFGFAHSLSAEIDAAAGFAPPGVPIPRDLASTIAAVGSLNIVRKLARDSTLQLLIAAVSGMSGGLALPHNLGMAVAAAAEFLPGFHVDLPILRPAGPLDLPGTINWHINPSAERELTNWFTEGAGPAITQDASESWDGTYSVKRVTTAASAGQGIMARGIAGMALTGLASTGTTRGVFGQMRVKGDSGSVGALVDLYTRVRYTDNTTVDGEHQQFALTNAWQYVAAPRFTLDPAKTLNYAEAVLATPSAEAVTMYADGVQIEEARGNSPTTFTIGSYGRETGYWVGVPHVSMSVRDPIPMLIQAVGRGGDVVIDARMYRMTWDGIPVEDISETVVSASVSMDAEREVTWAMDAVLTWEGWKRLTPNFDWIAPFMEVRYPNGDSTGLRQLGLYFVVPSEAERNEFDATAKLSCFDPLWLLQRQGFTGPLKVLPGEERVKAVRAILDGAVLTGGDQPGTPSRYAIPGDGRPWQKKREWPAKTPRLGLCNDILQSAGFYPLYTTGQGIITSRRMGDHRLAQRTPVKAWAANLPAGMIAGLYGGPGSGTGGGGGGGPLPIGGADVWIPRLASGISSEVVGAIKTAPKAFDMFDEILMINDDPDRSGIFVGGVVKGPNVDSGDEKRDHDHHRDRERRERHEDRDRPNDSHDHNRADRDRDREGRDRQDDSRHRDRTRNPQRNQDTRQVDAERNRQHDNEEQQRDRQRAREDARKDRERANQLGGKDRVVFKGKNRRRVKALYAPYVDDEATAQEIANALADELASTTQGVELSVLPDPSPNYCRETVICNIWDAMAEPVAVGHFAVKSAKWGFTPSTCVQTLALDLIDPGGVDTQPRNRKGQ
jgi:hypothetical protein